MRTLVTGGAGFIGSHLATALVAAGHEVRVVDNLSRGHQENVPAGVPLDVVDVCAPAMDAVIAAARPAAIFHLAAQMDVRASVADPLFDAQVNIVGTLRVLQAAARHGVQCVVLASTGGAIYGEQSMFPAPEAHPCLPTSPYGQSKWCAEGYLGYFARHTALRTVALRYANVYGPRQDPHGEAGVVAIFADTMLAGHAPTVFGDGGQTRDYVFVDDVVRANLLALTNPRAHGAYNIGTGHETDVTTLATRLARACGYHGPVQHAAARPGEQRRSVIDARRAEQELGWRPTVSLDDGLAQTVAWFQARRAPSGAMPPLMSPPSAPLS